MADGSTPQIKICGLSDPKTAAETADLGADAIGCVFFEKSPRNVSPETARAIRAAVPSTVRLIGVFVDEDPDALLRCVAYCGLDGVQLHGHESPDTVARLRREGLVVIKGLYTAKPPTIADAGRYDATAFLVECGKGPLPGGNAEAWRWSDIEGFSERYPLVLAGGLAAGTVAHAIEAVAPDAVDVSSAVEIRPGVKSIEKISRFIDAVRACPVGPGGTHLPRIVF